MKDEHYLQIAQIGAIYGVSRVVVGRWLKDLGFRDQQGNPTERGRAICKLITNPKNGREFWVWHKNTILRVLDQHGYQRGPLVSQFEEELRNSK